MTNSSQSNNRYHHGDLYDALLTEATAIIEQQGIDQLSLRKLAEHIGVSRTAAYHHFKNKKDLLCAIAGEGFKRWENQSKAIFDDKTSADEQFRQFIKIYLVFATENPALYDLMFGGTIWRENTSTAELKTISYASFQRQLSLTKHWQQVLLLNPNDDPLRLSQVLWGNLHGIARLINDGIYQDNKNIDAFCQGIYSLFIANTPKFTAK